LNGGKGSRSRLKVFVLALGLVIATTSAAGQTKTRRKISGIIYFTDNTPLDRGTFPVELFSRNKRWRIATAERSEPELFHLTGIMPGKYLLKLTWPQRCVLWYRVDLTEESQTDIRIVMDAACAHANGSVQDLPRR
jgi:hypothetical protein